MKTATRASRAQLIVSARNGLTGPAAAFHVEQGQPPAAGNAPKRSMAEKAKNAPSGNRLRIARHQNAQPIAFTLGSLGNLAPKLAGEGSRLPKSK